MLSVPFCDLQWALLLQGTPTRVFWGKECGID